MVEKGPKNNPLILNVLFLYKAAMYDKGLLYREGTRMYRKSGDQSIFMIRVFGSPFFLDKEDISILYIELQLLQL